MASERDSSKIALRWVAGLGTAAVLLYEAVSTLPLKPRQSIGLLVLVLGVGMVALTLRFLMPEATTRLLREKDLVVPLGIVTFVQAVLGWLALLPATAAVLTPTWPLRIWTMSFSLSLLFVLQMLAWVAYGTWMTTLVLETVPAGRADAVDALAGMRRWFWWVLGLEFLGSGVLFVGLALGIAIAVVALPLAMLAIGAGSVLWNVVTAALLPVALTCRGGFWERVRAGMQASWSGKALWWKPLAAQLLLLGMITLVSVSYTDRSAGSSRTHRNTNWSVNAFWIGGYESRCRWYSKLMEALEAPKLPFIETSLSLAFGVLAIGMKLTIVERLRLYGSQPTPPSPPPSGSWPLQE